jgi:CO/xanthine dehydrogenase FAD-binding subunit
LEIKASRPDVTPIAGGTDLMVDINFDRAKPGAVLDLTKVAELRSWERTNGSIRLGAGVTYATLVSELAGLLPGLAMASRTVGSPQIRNRGTVGGNLGTASPAGDALPPLVAAGAEVELASRDRRRVVAIEDFLVGPKENALESGELIVSVGIPVARGPQHFAKIGTRNAMVIAVASFALSLDPIAHTVRTGIGSAGPVILRATSAEALLADGIEEAMWEAPRPLAESLVSRFGELVAEAARPIDDVRGTARYRRLALSVLARRTLSWAWHEHMERT